MAKQEDKMENGDEAPATPAFDKPKPDYEKDPNVQARKRAAKRSGNRNSGKPVDDGVFGEAPKADGGIVAEAEEELAESKAEGEETPAMEEMPAEEAPKAEEETPAAEEPKTEEETPAVEAPKAEEETPAEEASETPAEEAEEGSEYQAPEGESHADLVHRYHEAIAYGDIQQADELYMQLQDHRYQENKFRSHKEAIDETEAREHLAVAKALAAKHPELAEDGIAANKVLALAEVYRGEGMKPAAALKQAAADLYPEQSTGTLTSEVPPAEPEAPAAESPAAAPAEGPAAEEDGDASGDAEASEPIADMEERAVKKRAIAEVPAASARNEPAPPPAKPTRSSAIVDMKRARGQL